MRLDYVPLLHIQREIQGMPFGRERFRHYLRTIWNCYEADFELLPLLFANPMGKDHVTSLLDELLALGADQVAADAAIEASARLPDGPGEWKAAVVVVDDLKGGWTNRYDYEFNLRFGTHDSRSAEEPAPRVEIEPPRWSKFLWVTGVLWSSEPSSARAVREAMLTAVYRIAFVHEYGPARTLREMLTQEGQAMTMAGSDWPRLDDDDIAYTREVLAPHLDATDKRTCIECLFGDSAGRTLGFTPRGLSPWAGLAMALHDARSGVPAINSANFASFFRQ
jgi:hypothetical protein